jgi:RHS repeat-associated protein
VAASAGGSTKAPAFGFTGQRYDNASGVYDYGARFYDPTLGRFLQPDSLVPGAFDSQALNRYAYVRNNPLGRIDPGGSWSLDFGLGLGTLSFSDTGWIDFEPGFNLGLGFTTQTYGQGFGFSLFGGRGGVELSFFGSDNDFRFGVSGAGPYATTPFGSAGAGLPAAREARDRALQGAVGREIARAGLGSLPPLEGRSWSVLYDPHYTQNKAETFRQSTEVVVGPYAYSGPSADLDSTVGHEFSHVFDQVSDEFYSRVNNMLTARGSNDERALSHASELRAYRYELDTAGTRSASWRARRNAAYHFDEHYDALESGLGAGAPEEVLSWGRGR